MLWQAITRSRPVSGVLFQLFTCPVQSRPVQTRGPYFNEKVHCPLATPQRNTFHAELSFRYFVFCSLGPALINCTFCRSIILNILIRIFKAVPPELCDVRNEDDCFLLIKTVVVALRGNNYHGRLATLSVSVFRVKMSLEFCKNPKTRKWLFCCDWLTVV